MIFVNTGFYAKVWETTVSEKYMDIKLSTSEKTQDGTYKYSKWFARAIGHAFNSLKGNVQPGDKIEITKCKLTNEAYKDKDGNNKTAFRFVIFEAEKSSDNDSATQTSGEEQQTPAQQPTAAATANEDSPW